MTGHVAKGCLAVQESEADTRYASVMQFDPHVLYTVPEALTPAQQQMVDTLATLEPAFIDAGRIARELQGRVDVEMKADTGNLLADVVTRADREVQARIVKTICDCKPLTECHLLAEETLDGQAGELQSRFTIGAPLMLTIDPIDGTKRYTENKPYYSTIIGLHDAVRPLYTFIHYPAFAWWVRIVDRHLEMSGPCPEKLDHLELSNTIVYTAGRPEQDIPKLAGDLANHGVSIRNGESVGPYGSKFLYLTGHAGGYYARNPNAYDGLFALHCALARGNTVLAEGRAPGASLCLQDTVIGKHGASHPGWYVVVPRAAH